MSQKLYVGNLPFNVEKDDLRELFETSSPVKDVNIIMDHDTGRPRGFAFVIVEDGDKVISELNGKELGGRPMRINPAKEKERKSSGYRGAQGNGYRGKEDSGYGGGYGGRDKKY